MFDTVVEVPEWEVCDSCPCDLPPEQVTVWDVLAGRVEPGPDASRALKSVNPRDLGAATRADIVSAWEAAGLLAPGAEAGRAGRMSAPEPVVNVDDPTDRGFAQVPERVATEQVRLALGCSPGWAQQRVWFAEHPRQPAPGHQETA